NGEVGGSFVKQPPTRGYGSTHFALSVATDAEKVAEVGARAGGKCFVCTRGPFHVIEVWVENETMVEILPPDYAAEYLAFTRPYKVLTAMASAATAGGRHPPQRGPAGEAARGAGVCSPPALTGPFLVRSEAGPRQRASIRSPLFGVMDE